MTFLSIVHVRIQPWKGSVSWRSVILSAWWSQPSVRPLSWYESCGVQSLECYFIFVSPLHRGTKMKLENVKSSPAFTFLLNHLHCSDETTCSFRWTAETGHWTETPFPWTRTRCSTSLSHLTRWKNTVHLWVTKPTTPSLPTANMTRKFRLLHFWKVRKKGCVAIEVEETELFEALMAEGLLLELLLEAQQIKDLIRLKHVAENQWYLKMAKALLCSNCQWSKVIILSYTILKGPFLT